MRSCRHPVASVVPRGIAGALVLALAACSSDVTTSSITPSETSRGLTRRLDRAGLCTSAGPLTGEFARAGRTIGISGAWQCVMPPLPNGSSGATEVVTWVAPSAAAKTRVTSALRDRFRQECAGPGGSSASGSSDGTVTPVRPVAPVVTMRYVEHGPWIAIVGINAELARVRPVLPGRLVLRRCGEDAPTGS